MVALIVWVVIAAAIIFVCIQMRAGQNWARITLTVLGGIGALLGLFGLIGGLIAGIGFSVYGSVYDILNLVLSLVATALLIAAIVLMYRPNANPYFR